MTRLRNVVVVVMAFFILGASSLTAVCELACGPQSVQSACHAGAGQAMRMAMSHEHCAHGMDMSAMQTAPHSVSAVPVGSCGHDSMPVFAKGGSGVVPFSAVQWVAVGVVPFDLVLAGSGRSVGRRLLVDSGGVNPLVVSLRV